MQYLFCCTLREKHAMRIRRIPKVGNTLKEHFEAQIRSTETHDKIHTKCPQVDDEDDEAMSIFTFGRTKQLLVQKML